MSDLQRLIQQVDELSEDRVMRNARIRELETERDALADALREISRQAPAGTAARAAQAARAAIDRQEQR